MVEGMVEGKGAQAPCPAGVVVVEADGCYVSCDGPGCSAKPGKACRRVGKRKKRGEPTLPVVVVNGQPLHYEMLGDGLPVLLVHGFTNYGLAWAPQLASLVSAGFRVVVPDLPGHGRSVPLQGPGTVKALADAVMGLVEALDLGPVDLCGLSLGGMVALEAALGHPQRVRHLILAATGAEFSEAPKPQLAEQWARTLEGPDGSRRRLREAWPHLVTPAFAESPAGQAVYEAWEAVLAAVPGTGLARIARLLPAFDRRPQLGQLRLPTMVVAGGADQLFPAPSLRAMAERMPDARWALLPGAGHLVNLERPDLFNRVLVGFLRSGNPLRG
jgi:3-oxoadipate enol-lactonase